MVGAAPDSLGAIGAGRKTTPGLWPGGPAAGGQGVPAHTLEPGPGERGVGEEPFELILSHVGEAALIGQIDTASGAELRHRGGLRESLGPGANLIADVAAEDPTLHMGGDVGRDGSAVLDGVVGEAAGGVEEPWLNECAGWACVEAASATTTMIGIERSIGRKLQVVDNTADYEP